MSHKTDVENINTNLQSILDMINALGLLDAIDRLNSDFEYTANADGTYTITGWKGTRNGTSSTELIIPNDSRFIL